MLDLSYFIIVHLLKDTVKANFEWVSLSTVIKNVHIAFSVQDQQTTGATESGESWPRPRPGGDQEALQGTED